MEKTSIYKLIAVTILIGTSASLASCAALTGPVAEKVAKAVVRYCEEPLTFRQIYRNTINSKLVNTGHEVHVHCAGDPAAGRVLPEQ